MPRKRLRPDHTLIVYKFWAKPSAKLPQAFWDKAKAMRDTWNSLVVMREETQEKAKTLEGEEKKSLWADFQPDCRKLMKKSGLDWEAQGELLDRFQAASRRAIKYKQTLRQKHGLKKIMIPHRFTGGGEPVNILFTTSGQAWRVKIDPVSETAYLSNNRDYLRDRWTRGIFGIDKDTIISFETIIHRPIPQDSIVKKVIWCGSFNRNLHPQNRWQWSIQIVVEQAPIQVERDDSMACGIDLGWRIMAEGSYLRIGMISDSVGRNIELRLPLVGTGTRSTRRSHTYSQYQDFTGLLELDSKIGNAVEHCKAKLRELLPVEKTAHLTQVRQFGLRKILRELQESGEDTEAQSYLEKWEEEDARLRLIKATVQGRLIGRRQWLYQNLACWLTKTYRVVVWEGELELKVMAEQKDKSQALAAASRYRQWASISNLRSLIKNAAQKNGCTLTDGETAYSTLTCWECGEAIEKNTGALFLICPQGHRHDQDVQAAKNLLNQAHIPQTRAESLIIHENLRKVIVPCS